MGNDSTMSMCHRTVNIELFIPESYPIILDNKTAALSIHPAAVQISKYSAVNIRSIVMLVANKTWFI